MNVDECLRDGILAKIAPDAMKAESSLRMAAHKLSLAEKEMEHGIYENAIVSAYTAMFHSARALLFRDGFKERSHYAVFVYLNEKYAGRLEKKYLNGLNALRLQRHELMYWIEWAEETTKEETQEIIGAAEGFLAAVKKLIIPSKQ